MRKLRVLVLMHHYLVPPDDVSGHDLATAQWKTEHDVLKTLRDDLKHDVHALGVKDDLAAIRQANDEFKPHIAFNLLEAFHEVGTFDQNVVSLPRAAAAALHRLQPARHVPGARQGALQEAAALSPHPDSRLHGRRRAAGRPGCPSA